MRSAVFLLAILLFVGIAFSQEGGKKVYKATIDTDGVQRVNIVGGEYYFDPNHIVIKVNVPAELTIKKDPSIVPHNIVIKEPEAGIEINESIGAEPKIIKFTPKKTGEYPFYCDKRFLFFKSHKERGMAGIFEIVE